MINVNTIMKSEQILLTVAKRYASHGSHPRQTLLPPLMLYRRLLRAHRQLPPLQRSVGDEYVRNEFKLHKDVDNPLHIVGFLTSWQDYLSMISNGEWAENTLSKNTLDKMSPEQVGQLYELMKESERIVTGEVDNLDSTKSTTKNDTNKDPTK